MKTAYSARKHMYIFNIYIYFTFEDEYQNQASMLEMSFCNFKYG